jgi:predicted glycoside hydrolase/deacetylase ChbG (UPF0249 family)
MKSYLKTRSCFFFAFCLFATLAKAQSLAAPRLIVRGDDMGYSHASNVALIQAYKEGIVTSIEVLVPAPWFPEAVQLLAQNPGVDVGVHLTITSEWDLLKWRPLTAAPSLRDSNGYLFPKVFPDKFYPKQSVAEQNWSLKEIEAEFRAQIELAKLRIPRLSHISAHMGCTYLHKDVQEMTKRLAAEYHLLFEPEAINVSMIGFEQTPRNTKARLVYFQQLIEKLQPGKTYLYIEHPGYDTDELKAVHHVGYEDVAADRQSVTDIFTNAVIIALIKQKHIQLIGYNKL